MTDERGSKHSENIFTNNEACDTMLLNILSIWIKRFSTAFNSHTNNENSRSSHVS